jgi:hypothetical protein
LYKQGFSCEVTCDVPKKNRFSSNQVLEAFDISLAGPLEEMQITEHGQPLSMELH